MRTTGKLRFSVPIGLGLALTCAVVLTTSSAQAATSERSGKTPSTKTTVAKPTPGLCTPTTLQTAQQTVELELSNRSTQLQTLATRISNNKDIPATDASKLSAIVSGEQTGIAGGGIAGLESKVRGATTCIEVGADARTMIEDFYVFGLVSPQVDLTAVASSESTILAQAKALEPNLSTAANKPSAHAPNPTGAQNANSDYQAMVAEATSLLAEVSVSNIVNQVPSDYPADAPVFSGYYTDVVGAATDLRAAGDDLRTIVADLN